jgi:hypothetical protein
MSRTINIEIYKINELSEKAKEKALNDYYDTTDYAWAKENEDTMKKFCEVFPVSLNTWEYDTCNGYYRFEFDPLDYEYEIREFSGIRLYKYLVNNYYDDLFPFKRLWHPKKGYSKVFRNYEGCPFTGYYLDNTILEPIYEFLKKPDSTSFYELMDRCFQAWIDGCVKDCEDYYTMERFIETSEANDWEYTADGKFYVA